MSRGKHAGLSLTQQAVSDLAAIRAYSRETWGETVAERYLEDLSQGLSRIQMQPSLLRPAPELPNSLRFYNVRKHLFACDVQGESIVVLAVLHVSMDVLNRLAELQPVLATEVELLHRKLRSLKT